MHREVNLTAGIVSVVIAATLLGIGAFNLNLLDVANQHRNQWNDEITAARIKVSDIEIAVLNQQANLSANQDDISSLADKLDDSIKKLASLNANRDPLLDHYMVEEVTQLIGYLHQYRDTVIDFESDISVYKRSTSVLYETIENLVNTARQREITLLSSRLLELKTTLLIVDQAKPSSEKLSIVDDSMRSIETEFATIIRSVQPEWNTAVTEAYRIILLQISLEDVTAEETKLRLEVIRLLDEIYPVIEKESASSLSTLIVTRVILASILASLILYFVAKSARYKAKLEEHANELEALVSLRTEALEMTMEDLKRSAAEKEKMAEDLRLSQRLESIGQLAAGIAHEINTPSQFVNDNLKFIQDAYLDLEQLRKTYANAIQGIETIEEKDQILQDIEDVEDEIDLEFLQEEMPSAIENSLDGMSRISKIVKSMKDFSHPGSDSHALVDVKKMIDTTLDVTRNEWKYLANIQQDTPENLPQVSAVETELNQVFLNIIVNAAHAIEDKQKRSGLSDMGTIEIQTKADDEFLNLRIKDSGCGIPQENIDRVFDPFFTTKDVGKGTGQGLAIARKIIVENHSGKLDVSSSIGEYTEFSISLPLPKTDTPPQHIQAIGA